MTYAVNVILIGGSTAFLIAFWWFLFKAPPPKISLYQCQLCKERVYVETGKVARPFVCGGCAAVIRAVSKERGGNE